MKNQSNLFVLVAALVALPVSQVFAQSGVGPSVLGAYLPDQPNGNNPTQTTNFENEYNTFTTLMGARPKYYLAYTDNSQGIANEPGNASWGAWSFGLTGANYVGPTSGTIPVIGIPMSDPSAQWSTNDTFYQALAAGTYDADIKGILDGWAGQGYTTAVFRPGYEFTGTTQAWSVDDGTVSTRHADFVAAFQRIVTDLRAEAAVKGMTIKISWCPAGRQGSNYDISTLYPGDSYVDVISTDEYSGGTPNDRTNWGLGNGTSSSTLTAWYAIPGNADHYYQWIDDGGPGNPTPTSTATGWSVQNTIDFAKLHNKPFAFDEFGGGGNTSGLIDDNDFPAWAAATIAGAVAEGVTIDHADIWDNGTWQFTNNSRPNESAAWAKGFGSTSGGSLPSGWTNTNIGTGTTPAGDVFAISNAFTVYGAGTSFTSTSDSFNYAGENETGDQTIIARITGVTSTSGGSKTAVMFRDSTAVGAIFIDLDVTPTGGVEFYSRTVANAAPGLNTSVATGVTPSATTPIWLKLVKSGTSYLAYYSTSVSTPSTWTQVGTAATVTLTQSPYLAGLGVCSYDNGTRAAATMDNVSVAPTLPQMLGAPITFASAGDLGNNFWSGTNVSGTTWNSGDYVTVSNNAVNTGWLYNPNSTGATGGHPGTAGGTPQSTYSTVILQADVAFDALANEVDSVGFYTNVNSAGNAGFVVLVCPQNSTSFDVRIGGVANAMVTGGSSSSPPPNPSTASFGSGFWLNTATGTGTIANLSGTNTFSTGTYYTVQVVEDQNITAATINYVVNIYTTSGVLIGSYNSGAITGVNTAYNQAGQVGVFTRDKTTSGTTKITNFAILPGTVIPFDLATDLENNFWSGATVTDATWDPNGYVDVTYNGNNSAWIYNTGSTGGTGGHPGTAGGATQSTYSSVTLQADVSFDALANEVDSFGFYTNINSASNSSMVVLVCPQNSTSFDVRIGGVANAIVSGGTSSSPPPNPSTVSFGSGFWLNAPAYAPAGQIVTLTGSNTFSTNTFYTVQLVESQNIPADTIDYKINVFNPNNGALMGSYDSGLITGVGTAYNQAGQVGVFTRDRSTTGTTHIQNLFISP